MAAEPSNNTPSAAEIRCIFQSVQNIWQLHNWNPLIYFARWQINLVCYLHQNSMSNEVDWLSVFVAPSHHNIVSRLVKAHEWWTHCIGPVLHYDLHLEQLNPVCGGYEITSKHVVPQHTTLHPPRFYWSVRRKGICNFFLSFFGWFDLFSPLVRRVRFKQEVYICLANLYISHKSLILAFSHFL